MTRRAHAPLAPPRNVPRARAPLQEREAAGGGVVSLRRGLRILEILCERNDGLSLAELSRELAVNKAIAVRLADGMVEAGFLFKHEQTGLYELTYKLSNLGLRKLDSSRLLDQAGGVLRRLAERTGELARLAVVEHGRRITWVLAAVGEKRSLRIDPNYRLEVGLSSHATGKAWLATLPWDEAWALIRAEGIEPFTPHTITGQSEIEADIAACGRRGYAVSFEENELGVGAVAAPIVVRLVSGATECVGAISLAAPTNRMTRTELEALSPLVVAATRELAAIWPIDARPEPRSARSVLSSVT
jgi:IclR family acetate operon transcriptional repressor